MPGWAIQPVAMLRVTRPAPVRLNFSRPARLFLGEARVTLNGAQAKPLIRSGRGNRTLCVCAS